MRAYSSVLNRTISELDPAVVCMDCNPLPWIIGADFGHRPTVYITNFFLTRHGREPTGQDRNYAKYSKRYNKLRDALGFEEIGPSARSLYEADMVLLADPEPVVPEPEKLPERFHLCGPCSWEPDQPVPDEVSPSARTIFFSTGSTGRRPMPEDLFRTLCETAGATQIITAGVMEAYGNDCPVLSFDSVPGAQIAKLSRLVVTQGGAGSTYQAICAGTPVACWPSHRNHAILARHVEKAGFGVALDPEDWQASVRRLRRDFAEIAERVKRYSMNFQNSGPREAARKICCLIGVGGTGGMGTRECAQRTTTTF